MTRIFDSHIHSEFSHDSTAKLSDICLFAKMRGASGITVTDHCDMHKITALSDMEHIKNSVKSTHGDFEIKVMSGMELGDGFTNVELSAEAARSEDFDFILCSCHAFATMRTVTDKFQRGDFNFFKNADDEILSAFLTRYYDNLVFSAEKLDYDSLAHITFPFRYINGLAERYKYRPENYMNKIEAVLETAVARRKAIEINTSGLMTNWGEFMPNRDILKKYFDMGGRLVTLGSDAHKPEFVTGGIKEAISILREIGFQEYFYYEKRKPVAVGIE